MSKFIVILILSLPFLIASISNSGGSAGGYSSSVGDGNKSCSTCHGGTATDKTNWISTTIPSSGYMAGQTYTITVSGTHSGVSRFGFEATAEDNSGNKVGTIIITNNGETKLTNSNKAITHTGNGYTPSGDNKSWSFDWTAPTASGTGDIVFYTALCAANGNMGTSGDVNYKSSLTVIENPSSSIADAYNTDISISPNPANDFINVKFNNNNYTQYSIIDITGKTIVKETINTGTNTLSINISNIAKGTYFLKLRYNDYDTKIKKFIKR